MGCVRDCVLCVFLMCGVCVRCVTMYDVCISCGVCVWRVELAHADWEAPALVRTVHHPASLASWPRSPLPSRAGGRTGLTAGSFVQLPSLPSPGEKTLCRVGTSHVRCKLAHVEKSSLGVEAARAHTSTRTCSLLGILSPRFLCG